MKKHLYYLVFALSYQQKMIFQFADRFLLELPHQHFLFFNLFLTLFLLTYIHLYTIAAKSPAFAGLFDKFLASIYSWILTSSKRIRLNKPVTFSDDFVSCGSYLDFHTKGILARQRAKRCRAVCYSLP